MMTMMTMIYHDLRYDNSKQFFANVALFEAASIQYKYTFHYGGRATSFFPPFKAKKMHLSKNEDLNSVDSAEILWIRSFSRSKERAIKKKSVDARRIAIAAALRRAKRHEWENEEASDFPFRLFGEMHSAPIRFRTIVIRGKRLPPNTRFHPRKCGAAQPLTRRFPYTFQMHFMYLTDTLYTYPYASIRTYFHSTYSLFLSLSLSLSLKYEYFFNYQIAFNSFIYTYIIFY
jgi:hypothetical protein